MAADETRPADAKSVSKSDFIREQPPTQSAAQIVEKAKAQGIDLRPGLVYEVRRMAKVKKSSARKKGATTVLAKKTSKASDATPRTPTTSKADFVRAHTNLSPKEIVEKAKAAGMKLEVGYVYNVRGARKAAAKKKSAAKRAAAKPGVSTLHSPSGPATTNEEEVLKIVAAEVGLRRAIEILTGERARVRAVIGT